MGVWRNWQTRLAQNQVLLEVRVLSPLMSLYPNWQREQAENLCSASSNLASDTILVQPWLTVVYLRARVPAVSQQFTSQIV